MSDTISRIPLQPTAWALSAALVATFIVCAGFELIAPELPVAHGWVELFTIRPVTSALGWIEGIIGSLASVGFSQPLRHGYSIHCHGAKANEFRYVETTVESES
jgi:hypothetical protein